MKALRFSVVLLALGVFASCGSDSDGLSEETTAAIAQFGTDWSECMTKANDWVSTAQSTVAQWDEDHGGMEAMMADWPEEKRLASEEHVAVCLAASDKGNEMIAAAQASIESWGAETEAWGAWSTDVSDQDKADKGLEEWNGKLTAANEAVMSWMTDWDAVAAEHTAAEAAIMGGEM